MMMTRDPLAAAIVHDPNDAADAAMEACVGALESEGVRVAGLLQHFGVTIAPGKREMFVTVLPTRETIRLNDPRGPGVMGCTLDAGALARAAMALRESLAARPDLLMIARFGKEEAAGGGVRAEIAEALLAGIPTMIGVRRTALEQWQAFLGTSGTLLTPHPEAMLAWARAVLDQTVLA
jgi:hypothetical protein